MPEDRITIQRFKIVGIFDIYGIYVIGTAFVPPYIQIRIDSSIP